MHGAGQSVDNREQQLQLLRKRWLGREQELITVIKRKLSAERKRKKLGLDYQRGQYHEHCQRSTKPRDLRARR